MKRWVLAFEIALLAMAAGSLPASDQVPAPKQTHPIILAGATIHPITSESIAGGQILFTDGRIVEVGKIVTKPEGAEMIDVTGKHIYPGFIAAQSTIGLIEIGAVRATRDQAEVGRINPNVRAHRAYNPDSELIPVARANGITLAHVAPQGGIISGTGAALMLDGWTWEDATLKEDVGIWVSWPQMVPVDSPWIRKSRAEQLKEIQKNLTELNAAFDAAEAYQRAKLAESGSRTPHVEVDLRWEALAPVLTGEIPLFVRAGHISQITAAVDWAKRRNLRIIIVGGADTWMVTDLLRENEIPVIVSPVLSTPARRWEPYDSRFVLPEKLRAGGVQFCISKSAGDNMNLRNLPYEAAMAVAFGLPQDEAIKSITLYPAQILGLDKRVGSLEFGKDATLIVTDGDPLDIRTQVEMEFIQGKRIDLTSRHTGLYEKYRERYRQEGILE